MRQPIACLLGLLTLVLAGCASGPPPIYPPVPTEIKEKGHTASHSKLLDNTDHMTVHLDEAREVVYVQSFGNSVAVGALLGPLGALANIASTRAATEADQAKLKDKVRVLPDQVFRDAARDAGFSLSANPVEGGANLSPYLHVIKMSDDKLLLASALVVEAPVPGALWPISRYLYQLPLQYTIDELSMAKSETNSEIEKQMKAGYIELIRFYQKDSAAAAANEKLVKYKSDFLSPRFDFEAAGRIVSEDSERIWVRHVSGVASVLKKNITIIGPWE